MPKIYQLLTDEIEEFVLQYINEHQLKPHDKLPTFHIVKCKPNYTS